MCATGKGETPLLLNPCAVLFYLACVIVMKKRENIIHEQNAFLMLLSPCQMKYLVGN